MSEEHKKLLKFISEVFPSFAEAASLRQKQVIDCIQSLELRPGECIIREGTSGSEGYLIKEGMCSLRSERNPLSLLQENTRKNAKLKGRIDNILRPKRGFWSNTISSMQFGVVQRGQWIGEERLIDSTAASIYSVTALTKVVILSLSQSNIDRYFTKEMKDALKHLVSERQKWLQHRMREMAETSRTVDMMDPSKEKYDEKLRLVLKRYPAALPYAIRNIRKMQILSKLRNGSNNSLRVTSSLKCFPSALFTNPKRHDRERSRRVRANAHERSRMSNANSVMSTLSDVRLVPVLNKRPAMKHRLPRMERASLPSMKYMPTDINESYFVVGSRRISPLIDTERPISTNPYARYKLSKDHA